MYLAEWGAKSPLDMSKDHKDSERLIVYSHPHYAQVECNISQDIADRYDAFEEFLVDIITNYEDENSPIAIRAFKERLFLRCLVVNNKLPVVFTMATHDNGHIHQNNITHSLSSLDYLRDYDNHYFIQTKKSSGDIRNNDQSWLNPETVLVGAGNYMGACLNSTMADLNIGQLVSFELNFTYANFAPSQQFSGDQRAQFSKAYQEKDVNTLVGLLIDYDQDRVNSAVSKYLGRDITQSQ